MAKSSNEVAEGEIREGLLCPLCLNDFKTVNQLQEHFEITHSEEDHDMFHTLKGFIGKAKRKILKQDTFNDSIHTPYETLDSISYNTFEESWLTQEIGMTSSHTQYFKKLRDKKIDRYVLETNKLLIRLDKLICDISDDPEKRKEFEKSIVPWVPDQDVPLCPGCAKSFGISRRRHHCRLCGGVMCNACSFFMSYEFARKLVLPMVADDQQLLPKAVLRRPSSVMSLVSGGTLIRICKDCNLLLQRRDKMVEQKSHKPVIIQMYERLKEAMDEIERLVPIYIEIIESLNLGETDYQFRDAQEVKIKITKLAERVDSLSKRKGTEEETNSRTLQLQSSVKMAASQFLRNMVLGLPSVPTPEDIVRFQSQRLAQVQRRIQLEKQATNSKELPKKQAVSSDTGWCVGTMRNLDNADDPLLQQIENIRNFITQARKEHKYDEVRMLEINLQELESEYSKQTSFDPL